MRKQRDYTSPQGLKSISEEEAGKLLEKLKSFLSDGALSEDDLERIAGGYGYSSAEEASYYAKEAKEEDSGCF